MKKRFGKLKFIKLFLDDFCIGDITTWKDRILLESVNDNSFLNFTYDLFTRINDLSPPELDSLFKDIIKQAKSRIDICLYKKNLINKYEAFLKVERYFGLIEQIDELSVLSENTYKNIICKKGYDFVEKLDQKSANASAEMFDEMINRYKDIDVQRYLVLKKWQNNQNKFGKEILEDKLKSDKLERKIASEFSKYSEKKHTLRNKFEIIKLLRKTKINIEVLSKYYVAGFLDLYKEFIGGKAFGLAILNCFVNIPNTYIVSCASIRKKKHMGFNPTKHYAVRSSADCEDSEKHSFAGLFDSYLNVNYDEISKYIIKVKESKFNERVQEYIKMFNLPNPKMNVIIQEFIDADISGVWIGNNLTSGVYETIKGVGEDLVKGKKVPQMNQVHPNDKLYKYFVKLQQQINAVCDFEFCVKNNKIYMLQCRPVTTNITSKPNKQEGVGASFGCVEGLVKFIDDEKDINKLTKEDILVTYATDPSWVPAFFKCKGVVTLFGGYLCHSAIIAREVGLPCVVGVDKKLFIKVKESIKIKINGFNGNIEILE